MPHHGLACKQTVREIPVAGVLDDLQGETKFEASGIAQRGHGSGQYFVVFDKYVITPFPLSTCRHLPFICAILTAKLTNVCRHDSACSCQVSDHRCVDGFHSVVCCSTRTIGELDERFQFKSNKSRLVKEDAQSPGRTNGIDDSQFEGALLQTGWRL
jgi:hypothetical protein